MGRVKHHRTSDDIHCDNIIKSCTVARDDMMQISQYVAALDYTSVLLNTPSLMLKCMCVRSINDEERNNVAIFGQLFSSDYRSVCKQDQCGSAA